MAYFFVLVHLSHVVNSMTIRCSRQVGNTHCYGLLKPYCSEAHFVI